MRGRVIPKLTAGKSDSDLQHSAARDNASGIWRLHNTKSNARGEPVLSLPFLVLVAGTQESRMGQRTDGHTTHCDASARGRGCQVRSCCSGPV